MLRRLAGLIVTPCLLGGLVAALFAVWMHGGVLRPANVGWLLAGDDRGQSAIGLAAYLRAGHWPSLQEPLLDAPEGLGLLFTDSIPLLGLVLGPLAEWLPPGIQAIGLWLLLCVTLQMVFAWRLLRPFAPDRLTALLATVLLAAMPALFNRYGHASLCAQWLILWSLLVYRDRRRADAPGWWIAVLGVAALIHSYLLVIVASFWGATLLRLVAGRGWRRAALIAAAPLLVVSVLLAWHGVLGGSYASTGTYGAFPAALDAWWNPANPSYSALLPSSPEDHGRGFEGFNYLGAGLLPLVVLAAMRPPTTAKVDDAVSLRWLLPGFAMLALIAIGPQPLWRGQALATFHLPRWAVDALDPVRAGGRLLWPTTYTLAYVALVSVLRRPRALVLLALAAAIQIVDLTPMMAAIRRTSARADDPRTFARTLDPRWSRYIANASMIEFEPPDPFRDLQVMEEVGWRAVVACRPLSYTYAARDRHATRVRVGAERAAFRAGRIDATRLYVLLDGRVPAGLAGRVQRLDGIAVIAPTAPAPPTRCVSRAPSLPRSAS